MICDFLIPIIISSGKDNIFGIEPDDYSEQRL
jgi:hypothetical protein